MEQYTGKSISNGIAIGKILYYEREQQKIKKVFVEDVQQELTRYQEAKEQAIGQLLQISVLSEQEIGQENADIFKMQALLLQDEEYSNAVHEMICKETVNAEYAILFAV